MVEKVISSVEEYNKAIEIGEELARNTEVGRNEWKPPEGDLVTLNTDAAVFSDGRLGCGGILRESKGEVLGCYLCVSQGSF